MPTSPDAAARSGVLYGDFETTIVQKDKVGRGLEAIGHTFVHESGYNITGEANWAPFAAALQADDVRFLTFVGEGENFALLAQAMAEIDYAPRGHSSRTPTSTTTLWVEAAGAGGRRRLPPDGVHALRGGRPEPGDRAVHRARRGRRRQGRPRSGAQSWSAWLMFAQAARDCDLEDDLTRSCVLEGAAAVTDWTGGGLHVATNPGDERGAECTLVLQVQDGEFTRFAPRRGLRLR